MVAEAENLHREIQSPDHEAHFDQLFHPKNFKKPSIMGIITFVDKSK